MKESRITPTEGENENRPTDDDGLFDLEIDGSGSTDSTCGGSYGPIDVTIGSHTVSESAGTGIDLADYFAPVITGDCDGSGNVTVAAGENAECTITNTRKGMADVSKTVAGGPIQPGQSFSFEIHAGLTLGALTNAVAIAMLDDLTLQPLSFACTAWGIANADCDDVGGMAQLPAGNYAFCEIGMLPGWSNVETDEFDVPLIPQECYVPGGGDPNVDNSNECVDFVLDSGETESFYIDDVPPPGGDPRTIVHMCDQIRSDNVIPSASASPHSAP